MLNCCSLKKWTILCTLCSMSTSAQFVVIDASMHACNCTVLTSLIIVYLMHHCYVLSYMRCTSLTELGTFIDLVL